jgi:hypothetical protein
MGRKVAIAWHASFSIGAGVLYFYFVLPRWPEFTGDTTHSLGTVLRIVAGALFSLAALPVVFTQLHTRKPELGTPQLALSIRLWSIVTHVLAGVLIIGTAISETWISLDADGQWLFAIYGAAAALGLIGFLAFYLSFVAELPPPPPKPITAKKPKKRGISRKNVDDGADADAAAEEVEEVETDEADATVEAEAEEPEPAETEAEPEPEPEPTTAAAPTAQSAEETQGRLRNRRPTGKGSHRIRRRTRAGVAVDETLDED